MTDIASNNKRALTDVDGNAPSVTKKAKGGKNKKVTQKELNEKIKWATKSELTLLLKDINEKFPAVQEAYRPFVPSKSPLICFKTILSWILLTVLSFLMFVQATLLLRFFRMILS